MTFLKNVLQVLELQSKNKENKKNKNIEENIKAKKSHYACLLEYFILYRFLSDNWWLNMILHISEIIKYTMTLYCKHIIT